MIGKVGWTLEDERKLGFRLRHRSSHHLPDESICTERLQRGHYCCLCNIFVALRQSATVRHGNVLLPQALPIWQCDSQELGVFGKGQNIAEGQGVLSTLHLALDGSKDWVLAHVSRDNKELMARPHGWQKWGHDVVKEMVCMVYQVLVTAVRVQVPSASHCCS